MFSQGKKIIDQLGQRPVHIRLNELKDSGIKIRQNLEEIGRKGRIKQQVKWAEESFKIMLHSGLMIPKHVPCRDGRK